MFHVISYSSGKDSDETLRQALARFPKERVRAVCCDTGNEHPLVFEHLAYLERRLGITVEILRADPFVVERYGLRLTTDQLAEVLGISKGEPVQPGQRRHLPGQDLPRRREAVRGLSARGRAPGCVQNAGGIGS